MLFQLCYAYGIITMFAKENGIDLIYYVDLFTFVTFSRIIFVSQDPETQWSGLDLGKLKCMSSFFLIHSHRDNAEVLLESKIQTRNLLEF